VASDEVKNFDQIKSAMLSSPATPRPSRWNCARPRALPASPCCARRRQAKPGERPAVAGARQLSLIADVVAVDAKASTITLKGPKATPSSSTCATPISSGREEGGSVEVT